MKEINSFELAGYDEIGCLNYWKKFISKNRISSFEPAYAQSKIIILNLPTEPAYV